MRRRRPALTEWRQSRGSTRSPSAGSSRRSGVLHGRNAINRQAWTAAGWICRALGHPPGEATEPQEALTWPSVIASERMVTVGMTAADVGRMEALVIGVLIVWVLVALAVAVVLGRGIRLADARSAPPRPFTTGDLPAAFQPGVSSARH